MPKNLPISKLQIIAERHNLPLGLVVYRNHTGFPERLLCATEIVDGEMISGEFEWPGASNIPVKKPEKTGCSGFEYPLKAPVSDGVNRGVKITRKRSRLKN